MARAAATRIAVIAAVTSVVTIAATLSATDAVGVYWCFLTDNDIINKKFRSPGCCH